MDSLNEYLKPEIIWFVVGVVMLILEFALPGLILFFFGVGACLVGCLCLIFDLSLNAQLIIFILSSIFLLLTLRKWLKTVFTGRIKSKQETDPALQEFIGEQAVVIEPIMPKVKGKVEFHGTNWSAESDVEIKKGSIVEIIGKENITLKVKPI